VCLLKAEKTNQMLKQVQHDMQVWFSPFCHPELVSGSRFWFLELSSKARPVGRVLYLKFWSLVIGIYLEPDACDLVLIL
jgi:hypothetical protein